MERSKPVYKGNIKEFLSNIKEIRKKMIAQYLSKFIQDNHMANSFFMYRYLRSINISRSSISKMPKDFGTLPYFESLDLSDNILGGNNDDYNWLWLSQTAIKNNLLFLDLSNNLLTELPVQVMRLNVLRTLKICHNKLKYLPQSIRNLQRLSILDVSDNNLAYLPESIFKLSLYRIDIRMNPFLYNTVSYSIDIKVSSLVELSVRKIIKQRITYDKVIPQILIEYLDKVMKYCAFCDNPCIDCYRRDLTNSVSYCLMAKIVQISTNAKLQFERYSCSQYCLYMHELNMYIKWRDSRDSNRR